jgi:hypothetical protein
VFNHWSDETNIREFATSYAEMLQGFGVTYSTQARVWGTNVFINIYVNSLLNHITGFSTAFVPNFIVTSNIVIGLPNPASIDIYFHHRILAGRYTAWFIDLYVDVDFPPLFSLSGVSFRAW